MKMQVLCCIFLLVSWCSHGHGYLHVPQIMENPEPQQENVDRGDPLILTPYLKEGKIKEAREAAKVNFKEFQDVRSFSGYLTVDEQYNSNLFFWFFPSKIAYEKAPVVLWLQGGPGVSSLYSLFAENGPFAINQNGSVELRNQSWSEHHSLIYIDNPVGTGFSITDGGYARNETIIGKALYVALLQFFQLFPELQNNDFFVAGESYAGKYIPAVSYTIHQNNPLADQKINLQGLAIGDGWIDPQHLTGLSDFLYQIGLIDYNSKLEMRKKELQVVNYIRKKQWQDAGTEQDLIFGDFSNNAGPVSIYNYLTLTATPINDLIENYLRRPDVKASLHVGNVTFNDFSHTVYNELGEDFMQSVAPWLSTLLSHYRTLIYNGQLDVIVAYPLTVNFLKQLKFSGAAQYKVAERHQWIVGSDIAGYVKEAGNLTEVLVRNAGHMVPADQPLWAHDMIYKFTRNQPLH